MFVCMHVYIALCGLACCAIVLVVLLSIIFFASEKFFGIYSGDPAIIELCQKSVYIYITALLVENMVCICI